MNTKTIKITTLATGIGLLLLSLTQKCYCTTDTCGDSLAVFIMGAFGIFAGGAALCWLANPLLLLSWVFIKNNKQSTLFSLAAVCISISFLFFNKIIDDEAGHYKTIVGYQIGYWLWLGSSLITLTGNLLIRFKTNTTAQ